MLNLERNLTIINVTINIKLFMFILERATKNSNEKIDSAAMIAFSGFVQRDPECAPLAAKCILAKIHSMQEWEALQALHVYSTFLINKSNPK